ncbi:hypothetical protein Verru16b_00194 [Lacunisphaera limnophila]|uniref:Uncharacterized protein n=1 Tax=Lacunisphaera limnophila TaxID=1838286 RepID=A0A1I7PHR2_9BACT|nr:hypothetical protein [Lacunisphaera limnophila]AOS43153.1 hypothetical protein Verru16b_00194 [Lacunisphaera limnophila]
MIAIRLIRPGLLLTGLLTGLTLPLAAATAETDALNALRPEAPLTLDDLRPQPRERPRLRVSEVLTDEGRLRVHGGLSFTVGGSSGGGSFHGTSAWASYYDPVTGISLAFSYSTFSGDGLYDTYPRYFSSYPSAYPYAGALDSPGVTAVNVPRYTAAPVDRTDAPSFIRSGASDSIPHRFPAAGDDYVPSTRNARR